GHKVQASPEAVPIREDRNRNRRSKHEWLRPWRPYLSPQAPGAEFGMTERGGSMPLVAKSTFSDNEGSIGRAGGKFSLDNLAEAVGLAPLDRLIGAIYEGAMESPPWQAALQLMRDSLQAAHVTLMLRPPSSENAGVMINTGTVTKQGIEAYETHFFAMDPFVRLAEGEVVTAEELIGKQWLQSTVYQEYLRPLGVRHLLGADIYTKEGIECRLRITRSHEAQPFSSEDKALIRFLLPHLKRSIQLHARLDFLECEQARTMAGTPEFQAQLRALRATDHVDYGGVAEMKWKVFGVLYQHFRDHHLASGTSRASVFRAFQAERGETLRKQALFDAMQAHFSAQDKAIWGWPVWPEPCRDHRSPEVTAFEQAHLAQVEYFEYLQWEAARQLDAAGARSAELGLGIGMMFDLAIGVAEGGAATWMRPELYAMQAS
ncbi:MAG: 4-alpha-glucanotransferase, partial [Nitrosospira sp.]|nr:4-alpha-glucanotransferase [Nitrosospira sp.]